MTEPVQTLIDPPSRASWWLPAAAVGVLIYLALVIASFDFTIDDTFISMRYADNLARHGQLVWNLGETTKVEGYSNLLWILLLTPLYRVLPTDPFLVAKLLSAAFGAATVVAFSLLASRLLRNRALVLLGTVLLAASRPLVLWGCSGMETTLYAFLVSAAIYLLLMEERRTLSFVTPVVLFLICLTRTEGVVFFAAAVLTRMLQYLFLHDSRYAISNRRWVLWNGLFFLLIGAWLTWKYLYYGSIIPLPVYLKGASGLSGVYYVRDFVLYLAPFIPLAIAGAFLGGARTGHQTAVSALTFYFAALCAANPILGLEFRLLLAAVPLVYLLSMVGLDLVIEHQSSLLRLITASVVCAFLLFWLTGIPLSYPKRLSVLAADYVRPLVSIHIPLGKWLNSTCASGGNASVALGDAGAIAFYSSCKIIDFIGLNDVEFAHRRMTPERLLQRNPDYLVLKSSSPEHFSGTDTEYGRLSDMIYTDARFEKNYQMKTVWVSWSPFYCLWLFERKITPALVTEGRDPSNLDSDNSQ